MKTLNYNAHHSPIGAFASFTLGLKGASGGLGLELGGPANQNIYIGLETQPGKFAMLPFYEGQNQDEAARYDVEAQAIEAGEIEASTLAQCGPKATLLALPEEALQRALNVATDRWTAGNLTFEIFSPVRGVPDPAIASPETLMAAVMPAVLARITVDNSGSTSPTRAIFGFTGSEPCSGMRRLDDTAEGQFCGIGQGGSLAIVSHSEGVTSALGFTAEDILTEQLRENHAFALGTCGLMLCEVPAAQTSTFDFAICFFRDGNSTSGLGMPYFYRRYFEDIEAVAEYALVHFEALREAALDADGLLDAPHLSPNQKWMIAHAVRSYYGSTQLLDYKSAPVWVVNEGEYRMMNTFDLTADHLYWEMRQNPWAMRNALDWFVERYSYEDKVRFPGEDKEYPGGISFTHDMGTTNVWSRPGYSSYEKHGLHGCFSHMTHEQLVNWICCATVYVEGGQDTDWRQARLPIFERCLQSLLNRDHPDPDQRKGLMQLDSSRCMGGAEITTYDSLDVSLGQSRANVYLASKIWGSYLGLERIFRAVGDKDRAETCKQQAHRTMATIVAHVSEDGSIPAVLEEGNLSRIIPAIEGLAFPYFNGRQDALDIEGEYGDLLKALRGHLLAVLKPGICLFEDGGWKLSSTSNNSWLSKIYLCQFVAREILGLEWDANGHQADEAHVNWLLDPQNAYFAWSDQMVSGRAQGSKYYPRGVTNTLWLLEE